MPCLADVKPVVIVQNSMCRAIKLLVSLGIVIATFISCGGNTDNGIGKEGLKVVSTISPITSIVENIGGTKIQLDGLIPEGMNSHIYEPSVSVVTALAEADLIVLNGLMLEEPTLELAKASKKNEAVILLLGDRTITPGEFQFDFSFPEAGGKPNPHLWLDPLLALKYAELIYEELVALDQNNADYYSGNLQELSRRLHALDASIAEAVKAIPDINRKLLTYHDSWAYWAMRYDFEVIGAIQPSNFSEPSAKEIVDLIQQINTEGVLAIFGSEVFPSPIMDQIANGSEATYVDNLRDDVLPSSPGESQHSYLGMMLWNMQVMLPALSDEPIFIGGIDTSLVFTDGPSTAKYAQ